MFYFSCIYNNIIIFDLLCCLLFDCGEYVVWWRRDYVFDLFFYFNYVYLFFCGYCVVCVVYVD